MELRLCVCVWGGWVVGGGGGGGGGGNISSSFQEKKALQLGMKVQDAAFPAECWVSIIARCSVTALHLSAVITSSSVTTDRPADSEPRLLTREEEGVGGRGGGVLNSTTYLHLITPAFII